jgi:hypothetical protein
MPNPDLLSDAGDVLRGAGELLRGADLLPGGAMASVSGALSQLVTLATSQVPGCSGASAALWRGGELAVLAASHPDLAELAGIEHRCGRGPVVTALAAGGPVWSPDTLGEDRWPEYAAAALARGVRCSVTLVHQSGPLVVTLSLFGAQPGGPGSQTPPAIGS